jgi:hypothetical protein
MGAVIEMFSFPMPANYIRHHSSSRRIALGGRLLFAVSVAVMLAIFATPALAVVTKVEGHTYGVTPRSTELIEPYAELEGLPVNDHEGFANPEGHAVVPSSNVYAIYWDPSGYEYHGDWQHVIDRFLHDVGAESGSLSNVFAVDTQYLDKTDHRAPYSFTFRGAYTDTDPYPTPAGCKDPAPLPGTEAITCLTDGQIQAELKSFIEQHALQTGMNAVFYMLTPPGVTVCLDGGGPMGHCSDYEASAESYEDSFCSYHNYINPTNAPEGDGSTILYAVVPWIAGALGDPDLADERSGYECQDGGRNPTSKPPGKVEEAKEKTKAEEETIKKMDKVEKESQEEKEKLEGPHQQEPNQIGKSPDGGYDTGLADLIINQIAVEQQDITTDPLLDGWQNQANHYEVMDECRNVFYPVLGGSLAAQESTEAGNLYDQTINADDYYLNNTFNLAGIKLGYPGVACMKGVNLIPQFTSPNPVKVNELVGFDGMESDITLNAGFIYTYFDKPHALYATYTWNFGDGSPLVSGEAPGAPSVDSPLATPCSAPWEAPCAASTYHSYQYGGTYDVTLTVTDVGGNTASFSEPITVVGPPPPSPPPTPTPSSTPSAGTPSSSGSGGSGGGSSQSQTGATASVPAPVVTASIASTSLKKIKNSGLAVRYTVNEQVAGSVQVLLESSVAKRLGIKGPLATGLANGLPRSIVIGTAVLVTTKAGAGTIRIKFASRTAARLARSHKLKLMLRLVTRNASRQHPLTTTTLSTIVLS